MTILVLRSVVALLALFISILIARPVVSRVRSWRDTAVGVVFWEALVVLISWQALLILLRVF
jgi:hypothetical protein